MKSKNKIIKRTSAVFGLAAVPTAAALGLSYGIRDSKIDLSLSPAHDYGERYFDNKIVKVNDDDFASDILYNPLKREKITFASAAATTGAKAANIEVTKEQEKSADIAGLVRLDRKLDINYAHDVIEVKPGDTNQGSIDVDGGLKYPFHDIHEIITDKDGNHLYGKDVIKGMEEDAKIAITKAILDYKEKRSKEGVKTKTLNLGIYFDKNVIDRTVSIYLYELKGFDDEQQKVIDNFVNTVDGVDINQDDVNEWIKHFSYNVDYSASDNRYGVPLATQSYDRIDGKSEKIDVDGDGVKDNGETGFPEFFGGDNIMGINEMNNWYRFGGIEDKDEYDLSLTEDGKIAFRDTTGGVMTTKAEFDSRHPNGFQIYKKADGANKGTKSVLIHWADIESRIKNSKYINFGASLKTNPIINNVDVTDKSSHVLGPVQFVEKGIVPIIEPSVDFKNHVLKVKYTFKAFRKQGQDSSRSVGSFTMGEDISNPYEMSTYIKEIPLDNMGKVQQKDGKWKDSNLDGSRTFEGFYEDPSTNIDETKPGYDKLKASVVKAFKNEDQSSWTRSGGDGTDPSVKPQVIDRTSAKAVLKEFLTKKTPEYAAIPIVGPGLGILGQMIPSIATSVQQWMNIGNMVAADATIADKIFTDTFMDNLINKLEADPTVNTPALINGLNSFTKEAWSDLNSLIGLSGKKINGERYARTFLLYHLLAAITDINEPIMKEIKDRFPNVYIGSHTSVLDQLMSWLKKNGIISSEDSLMDIVNNYRTRLGTIVETLGINRPTMHSDLIQQLVNLIPLPLFSTKDGRFNVDTTAVLDALINGKYIPKNSNEDNAERTLPAIIKLLNGGGRTSVQTFFQHILNDKSADLFKYILGVIGADFSKTDTFEAAVRAIYTVFESKVPDYNFDSDGKILMIEQKGDDGKTITDKTGTPVKIPSINKDADGKDKMIINPTFGGIGIALENMFNSGIHSVPKESYESILKFTLGTIGSFTKMGTLTNDEVTDAAEGFYHFISQGAGEIIGGKSTSTLTSRDIEMIIRAINAIGNKEVISPSLGKFIFDIMEKGVGDLQPSDIEPVVAMVRPMLKGTLKFDDATETNAVISTTLYHLFTGFKDKAQVVKELGDLVPMLKTTMIPHIPIIGDTGSLLDLIGDFAEGSGSGLYKVLTSAAKGDIHKILMGGIANMADDDWKKTISDIKPYVKYAKGMISDEMYEKIEGIINGNQIVDTLKGVGHLLRDGLVGIDYNDISTILSFINSLNVGFSIPDELVVPLSLLLQNIVHNGIDAAPEDIKTILATVQHFAGGSIANIVDTINEGNPEQETGEKKPDVTDDAFYDLLLDFVVGNKYKGNEGQYAIDKISSLKLPEEVTLATDPDHPDVVLARQPGDVDPTQFAKLVTKFGVVKQEILSGHAFNGGDYKGKEFSADELYEKWLDAQKIRTELAEINTKITTANAAVQIYIDALERFKEANAAIAKVNEVVPNPALTGDKADYAKAIDELFKLMKNNMLQASSEDTFWTLLGKDEKGQLIPHHPQQTPEQIKIRIDKYKDVETELGSLNDLLRDLNGGKVGANFLARMTTIFTNINSRFNSEGVKGVLPGLPPALKTLFDSFLKNNAIGSDSDGKAAYVEIVKGWISLFDTKKPHAAVKSTARKSFEKFLTENWKAITGNGGVISDDSRQKIAIHYQTIAKIESYRQSMDRPFQGGSGTTATFDAFSKEILGLITNPQDHKIFQQLIDEFKKHIS